MTADPDALDRYAEAAWKHRCDRMAEARERPMGYGTWAERTPFLREIDRSVCSLVAAMAVHDAGLQSHADAMELARFRSHLPAILDALHGAIADAGYAAQAKPFKAALEALSSKEEKPS
jgi:hypothetical protein